MLLTDYSVNEYDIVSIGFIDNMQIFAIARSKLATHGLSMDIVYLLSSKTAE